MTTYEVFYLSMADSLGYFEAETEEAALEEAAKYAYGDAWHLEINSLFAVELS